MAALGNALASRFHAVVVEEGAARERQPGAELKSKRIESAGPTVRQGGLGDLVATRAALTVNSAWRRSHLRYCIQPAAMPDEAWRQRHEDL